jgi:hypothetical protein
VPRNVYGPEIKLKETGENCVGDPLCTYSSTDTNNSGDKIQEHEEGRECGM